MRLYPGNMGDRKNKNKMDLREIKTRKANLEDEILDMIMNFMNETGVSVNSIDFNVRISGNDVYKITSSNVKIRVEI